MGTGAPEDHYECLGIGPDADDAELRRAWRRLVMRWHPDRAGPDATATFRRLLAAYAVMSDPLERAAYDRRRAAHARTTKAAATPRPGEKDGAAPRRRAPSVMLERLCGPLHVLLAGGSARRAESDVIEIFLNAREVAQGGMISISMWVWIRCPDCAEDTTAACARCDSKQAVEELFSAWLAVPPDVAEGTVLAPSALLRGMLRPVSFRVRFSVAP